MFMIQDMERAVRFYGDVLGLDVEDQTPEWSRLALRDEIIVLRGGGTDDLTWTPFRGGGHPRSVSPRAEGRGCILSWDPPRQWLDSSRGSSRQGGEWVHLFQPPRLGS